MSTLRRLEKNCYILIGLDPFRSLVYFDKIGNSRNYCLEQNLAFPTAQHHSLVPVSHQILNNDIYSVSLTYIVTQHRKIPVFIPKNENVSMCVSHTAQSQTDFIFRETCFRKLCVLVDIQFSRKIFFLGFNDLLERYYITFSF